MEVEYMKKLITLVLIPIAVVSSFVLGWSPSSSATEKSVSPVTGHTPSSPTAKPALAAASSTPSLPAVKPGSRAVGSPPSATLAAEPKGRFVIARANYLTFVIDPTIYNTDLNTLLFWQLTQQNREGNVTPEYSLADKWESSKDNKEWTFHIRENAKWEDGTPITADDVKFSIPVLWSERSKVSYTSTLRDLLKADPTNIQIIDKYTVRFKLADSLFNFPELMSQLHSGFGLIVPKQYIEKNGWDYFSSHPMGSGPYKLKQFVSGEKAVLEAVTNHPYFKPRYKEVEFRQVLELSARMAMLRNGEADAIDISYDKVAEIEKAGLKVLPFPNGTFYSMWFNEFWRSQVTADIDVRKAIIMAIDRKALAKAFFAGKVTYGVLPGARMLGLENRLLPPHGYDPEAARAIVKAKVPKDFSLTMYSYPQGNIEPIQQEAIADMLTKVGFKVDIVRTDFDSFRQKWMKGTLGKPSLGFFPTDWRISIDPSIYLGSEKAGGRFFMINNPPAWAEEFRAKDQELADLRNSRTKQEYLNKLFVLSKYLYDHYLNDFQLFQYKQLLAVNPRSLPPNGWALGAHGLRPNYYDIAVYPVK